MKRIFKQQLYDYLFQTIDKNKWEVDYGCEKELNALIGDSIDNLSHHDCAKEEMRQFAKTNLLHLLAYMHLDAKGRGLYYIDSIAVNNALSNFNSLWPFKTAAANSVQKPSPLYMQNPAFSWYY
jgi:hypothetical protein